MFYKIFRVLSIFAFAAVFQKVQAIQFPSAMIHTLPNIQQAYAVELLNFIRHMRIAENAVRDCLNFMLHASRENPLFVRPSNYLQQELEKLEKEVISVVEHEHGGQASGSAVNVCEKLLETTKSAIANLEIQQSTTPGGVWGLRKALFLKYLRRFADNLRDKASFFSSHALEMGTFISETNLQ